MIFNLDPGTMRNGYPNKNKPKYIKKFRPYDIPIWKTFFIEPEYIGEFTMIGYTSEDMDEIQEWANEACIGIWTADYVNEPGITNMFVIKFQLEEDATLFKLVWQDDS